MQVNCYLSPGCTAELGLREIIGQALALAGVEASVQFHRIEDEEAVTRGLSGSPSIFINKKKLQPQHSIGFA